MTRAPGFSSAALVALHLLVALAGFVAPYDPASQDRSLPYAPPTALHIVDASGQFQLALRVRAGAGPERSAAYIDDTARAGSRCSCFTNGHLFAVDAPARLSLFGTDGFGRDVFSRVLHGGRISVAAGLLATMCALLVGLTLGTLAGFFGGVVDRVLMRAADVFMALPWIYLLFAVRAALPLRIDTRATFLMLVAVLGIVGWARPARMIRGIVLSARERTYVRAARRLRRRRALSAVASHPAAHLRPRADPGQRAHSAVPARRSGAVLSRARHR